METEMYMPFGTKIKEEISKVPPKKVIFKNITFPIDLFDEFDKYAEDTSGHCYWLAIKELMEFKKKETEVNSQVALLLKVIESMDERIVELELDKLTDKPNEFKTFGGKEK